MATGGKDVRLFKSLIIVIKNKNDCSNAVTNKTLHRHFTMLINKYATGVQNTVPEMIKDWSR